MTSSAERFSTPVAIHLFLMQGDEVLLIRRYNTDYEDGNYSVIAGHIDGGETVMTAMRREAYEEGGIELDAGTLQPAGVMHRRAPDGERIDWRSQPLNAPSSLSLNRTVAKGSGQDWCARRCGLLVVDWAVSEGSQVSGCVPVEKACDHAVAVRRRWGYTGPDRTWTGS
jgi:hypothetical protein